MVKLAAAALLLAAGVSGKIHNMQIPNRRLETNETLFTALINADEYDCPPNYCVTALEKPVDGRGSPEVIMKHCGHLDPDDATPITVDSQSWEFRLAKPRADFAGLLSDGYPAFQIVSKSLGKCVAVKGRTCDPYGGELILEDCDGKKDEYTYWMGFTGGAANFYGLGPGAHYYPAELNLGCLAKQGVPNPLHVHCQQEYFSYGFLQVPVEIIEAVSHTDEYDHFSPVP